jgi:hypothetical protein
MDSVGAVDDADMGLPASNGNNNDESPTTNTTTYMVLLSLMSLTGLEVKSLWCCYFWGGVAMELQ